MTAALSETDYVPIEPALALPRHLAAAEAEVRQYDPALRLRQSLNRELRRLGHGYILERKTRYTKPVDSEVDRDVAIASRDGYHVISPVHISLLMRPEALVERLRQGDGLATRTADSFFQQLVSEQSAENTARRDARRDDFAAYYRESYDLLDRTGDKHSHAERMRLNNSGGEERFNVTDRRVVRPEDVADSLRPQSTSAGESPAKELSDVYPPRTPVRATERQLHGSPAQG